MLLRRGLLLWCRFVSIDDTDVVEYILDPLHAGSFRLCENLRGILAYTLSQRVCTQVFIISQFGLFIASCPSLRQPLEAVRTPCSWSLAWLLILIAYVFLRIVLFLISLSLYRLPSISAVMNVL
jgi:hypothetical protein